MLDKICSTDTKPSIYLANSANNTSRIDDLQREVYSLKQNFAKGNSAQSSSGLSTLRPGLPSVRDQINPAQSQDPMSFLSDRSEAAQLIAHATRVLGFSPISREHVEYEEGLLSEEEKPQAMIAAVKTFLNDILKTSNPSKY